MSNIVNDALQEISCSNVCKAAFCVQVPPPPGWRWEKVEGGTFCPQECKRLRNLNGGYDSPVCRWEVYSGRFSNTTIDVIVPKIKDK